MRKAIGAVCITVLCAALLTGCSNTAGSVSESLNEENSSSSQQAYSEEISDNESNDLIAEAEEALEQGRYEEAVEKSVKGYLMKEDSTGFETITLRVAEKLAEEQGFDNPMASKEETFDKKYYEIAIKCDSFKGKDIGTLSEEQLIEVYKELDDAFFEPISKSCYMASNQRYLFSLGDIYCNGKWYDVFLGEDVGLENSVNVISDSEKSSQQKVEKQNTKSNATHNNQTVSQEYKNALSKGLQYANQLHMSKKAIYDQLTSSYGEGFPADAAQYAIDNMTDVDWNANALEKAKEYYTGMSMSKSAVYDQLTSEYGEQFTASEAQYAIDHLN